MPHSSLASRRWSLVARTLLDPRLRTQWLIRLGGRDPDLSLVDVISRFVLRKEVVDLDQLRGEVVAQREVAQRRLEALNGLVGQLNARRAPMPAVRNYMLFFWAISAMERRARGSWR